MIDIDLSNIKDLKERERCRSWLDRFQFLLQGKSISLDIFNSLDIPSNLYWSVFKCLTSQGLIRPSEEGVLVIPESIDCIDSYAFCEDGKTLSPAGIKEVRLHNGIVRLENWAFNCARTLERIVIPDSIDVIPCGCFSSCRTLNSVTLPDSVKRIEASAFIGCSSLASIDLPSSIKVLGKQMFFCCVELQEIQIPEGVLKIPLDCFRFCENLRRVVLPSTLQTVAANAFAKCPKLEEVLIPDTVSHIRYNPTAFDESVKGVLPKAFEEGII